jgi:hypothetical protein
MYAGNISILLHQIGRAAGCGITTECALVVGDLRINHGPRRHT